MHCLFTVSLLWLLSVSCSCNRFSYSQLWLFCTRQSLSYLLVFIYIIHLMHCQFMLSSLQLYHLIHTRHTYNAWSVYYAVLRILAHCHCHCILVSRDSDTEINTTLTVCMARPPCGILWPLTRRSSSDSD